MMHELLNNIKRKLKAKKDTVPPELNELISFCENVDKNHHTIEEFDVLANKFFRKLIELMDGGYLYFSNPEERQQFLNLFEEEKLEFKKFLNSIQNGYGEIVLFRSITKTHHWWRLNIGFWWASDPYYSISEWYMGEMGELYIATRSFDDVEKMIQKMIVLLSGPIYQGKIQYGMTFKFNLINQRFTSLRKVTDYELKRLKSKSTRQRYENGENLYQIYSEIFPSEYKKFNFEFMAYLAGKYLRRPDNY